MREFFVVELHYCIKEVIIYSRGVCGGLRKGKCSETFRTS